MCLCENVKLTSAQYRQDCGRLTPGQGERRFRRESAGSAPDQNLQNHFSHLIGPVNAAYGAPLPGCSPRGYTFLKEA